MYNIRGLTHIYARLNSK